MWSLVVPLPTVCSSPHSRLHLGAHRLRNTRSFSSNNSSSSSSSSSSGTPGAQAHAPKAPGRMNKLLQNVNLAGTSLFFQILGGNQSLALPHISVPDISWIDWQLLQSAGYKVCIFDKDNTLCEPFALQVPDRLLPSFQQCQEAFGRHVVLFSNSAGLQQYDPQGEEAAALEAAFGVAVLRHVEKKPAGGCEELQQQFQCEAHEMVIVGDRYLTDVVYGNRHGMLTIRVTPLISKGEPPSVAAARLVEEACVKRWGAAGLKAPPQRLLQQDLCCRAVRQPPEHVQQAGSSG